LLSVICCYILVLLFDLLAHYFDEVSFLDELGEFHEIQNAEDFALSHDLVRNVHTVYVIGACLSGMAKWKVVTALEYWVKPSRANANFDVVPGSISLESVG
jgi:hypothetical protein